MSNRIVNEFKVYGDHKLLEELRGYLGTQGIQSSFWNTSLFGVGAQAVEFLMVVAKPAALAAVVIAYIKAKYKTRKIKAVISGKKIAVEGNSKEEALAMFNETNRLILQEPRKRKPRKAIKKRPRRRSRR